MIGSVLGVAYGVCYPYFQFQQQRIKLRILRMQFPEHAEELEQLARQADIHDLDDSYLSDLLRRYPWVCSEEESSLAFPPSAFC